MKLQQLSYSGIRTFCNCRRAYYWKYIKDIESIKRADYFSFGSMIHECLESFYKKIDYNKLFLENYPEHSSDEKQAKYYGMGIGMMQGYEAKYSDDLSLFDVIGTELEFEVPIINPATGRHSRKFTLRGKIDGIISLNGKYWILEHKTAAKADTNYLDTLWHDLQITLYAVAYEMMSGVKIEGILYNILKKTGLRLKKSESLEEYKERIIEQYITDPEMYLRSEIILGSRRKLDVVKELWDITQAANTNNLHKNRSQCQGMYGSCEYFKICNSGDNPLIIENYYKRREHEVTNGKEQDNDKSF
jgi:hypothetical protein